MNLQSRILLPLLVIFITWLQSPASVNAQADTSFFVATNNLQTQESNVWRILPQANISELVFTISNIGTIELTQALPASELELLTRLQRDGFIPTALDAYRLAQTIERVWALSANQILVLVNNQFCISISERYCFGYFSYILTDFSDPINRREIWRLSYRDVYSQIWEGCISSSNLDILDTKINPTQQNLAILIRSAFGCLSTGNPVATLIVDYGSSPVQVNIIPLANYPAWSPDGDELAYSVQSDDCSTRGCSGAINVFNVTTNSTRTVASSPYFRIPALVAWENNQTLTYQFAPISEAAYNAANLLTINTISGEEINDIPLQTRVTQLYRLQNASGIELLATNVAGGQELISDESASPLTSSEYTIFYNERFPSYAVLGMQNSNPDTLLIVDAGLQQTSISLANYISVGETVVDISPCG